MGVAAVEIAKAGGATVLAGLTSPDKRDVALAAGADAIIDLSAPNLHDGLREEVFRLTGGKGADVVIDPIGGDVFDASLRALARRGRIITVGFASGRIPAIKANYLLLKTISATGCLSFFRVAQFFCGRTATVADASTSALNSPATLLAIARIASSLPFKTAPL